MCNTVFYWDYFISFLLIPNYLYAGNAIKIYIKFAKQKNTKGQHRKKNTKQNESTGKRIAHSMHDVLELFWIFFIVFILR